MITLGYSMPLSETDAEPSVHHRSTIRLSTLLQDFAATFSAERVRVRDIIDSLGHRSFGFILLIFALPNSLPILGIPGVSTITGLPILLVAMQMALGHKSVYLPRWISDSSIATSDFQRLISKVSPWIASIERLLKPRIARLTQSTAEPWLGAFCALMAILLVLPIPFGNLLPGLSILCVALGLIERDGVCVLLGFGLGISSWVILSGVIWLLVKTLLNMVHHFI